ncbi:NAD(P)-binding protein [Pleurotus eryngii]|uniref:NAD(P)-binding protein n=1 Tax=Pleurotus eryngii TaxID=5323 RepID=A0A9P6AA70_PLEER|nr:NAD(P)-binding protein [Pleurotus eryngii]
MATQPPLVGLAAALASQPPTRTVFAQFSLVEKVALVTGGGRGIGLEVAAAFAEAGAIVYCLGQSKQPHDDFVAAQEFVAQMPPLAENVKNGRMVYISGDVTDQKQMWKVAENIVATEGRLDICFANAGILRAGADCLEYSAEDFTEIINVNVNSVLYTAQAAGRQMEKLGIPGSIILNAGLAGSISIPKQTWVAYTTSKSAIIQMARPMACELGPKGIRVNTVSLGYIYTKMTKQFLDNQPGLMKEWSSQNPLGRLGRTDESRGVCLWLASDASTFCTGSDIIVDGGHRAW